MRKSLVRIFPSVGVLHGAGADLDRAGASPAVLHFGDTPSLHYYWLTRFPSARFVDTAVERPDSAVFAGTSSVVLVRHIASAWGGLLRAKGDNLPPVVWFLDDDIPGVLGDAHLPFRYALKTASRYARLARTLRETGASVLVSTPGLAARYGLPESAVLPPLPVRPAYRDDDEAEGGGLTVFYHGTTSHLTEIHWLKAVAEAVSERLPGTVFELFGDVRVNRVYRGMPNVRVVHPMTWAAFRAYTSSVRHAIGLAPLMDTPFNACRSYVKYFDITRSGGVGVYADHPAFRPVIRQGENGLLADGSVEGWVDAVCRLGGDGGLRRRLYRNAADHVASLVCRAGEGG